jgi:hypothetical protein
LVLVLSALVVGVGGGLGAVFFVWLLRQISSLTPLPVHGSNKKWAPVGAHANLYH